MVRAALGRTWKCLLANDADPKKIASYQANWGKSNVLQCDVRELDVRRINNIADLAWASFPCQDLSQAGAGAGLAGERSGVFWPFWRKLEKLNEVSRSPNIVILENVRGTITSHKGKDFAAICSALSKLDYRFGAVVIDAREFLPQSRPRLFFIGVKSALDIPLDLVGDAPSPRWHSKGLVAAYDQLPPASRNKWVWWNLPTPPHRRKAVSDVLQADDEVLWHSKSATVRLLGLMDNTNLGKVAEAKAQKRRVVGAVYRRRRPTDEGGIQRAEVRFDDLAGCLRTPAGGSSLQTILVVDGANVRSRLLTPRECARLMGLIESYQLPDTDYDAYHLIGDGVAVPVVRFIARRLVEPVLCANRAPLAVRRMAA